MVVGKYPPPPAPGPRPPLLDPTYPPGSAGPVQRLAPAMTPSTIVHELCSKPTVNIPTCFIRNTLTEAVCSQNPSNNSDQTFEPRNQIASFRNLREFLKILLLSALLVKSQNPTFEVDE